MLGNDPVYYFAAGASALSLVRSSLAAADLKTSSVRSVLDYACGYGRVLRWLIAAFPSTIVSGVDADKNAAASAAKVLSVKTSVLDVSLQSSLGSSFDLIWVGSLFTHLPKTEFLRVLKYVAEHLNPGGLLVFTTHGDFVVRRLETGQKDYGLGVEKRDSILLQYKKDGYGFIPYSWSATYGISVSDRHTVEELIATAGVSGVLMRSQGWANHQDGYACFKALDLRKRSVLDSEAKSESRS